MPELPEVETVRRGLEPVLTGATIVKVELRRPDLRFPFPSDFAGQLERKTIDGISRRAKYLLVHLSGGQSVIAHLGMSGSFRIIEGIETLASSDRYHHVGKNGRHDHVVLHLKTKDNREVQVLYNDPRRFGFMLLCATAEIANHPMLASLGIEPTGNTLYGLSLAQLLAGRKTSLKAALMDQKLIAGLGNIYVCEALWRAGLSPRRIASSLARNSATARNRSTDLATAVRTVIAEAIEAGGSTLRDHRLADGSLGYFQHHFSVYDREGHPCPRPDCDGTIRRLVQNGRSTFYCPRCQH